MLNRIRPRACVECGLPYGHTDFSYHSGKIESGPAYWSDRGLLCSHACSTAHFERREKEGDSMKDPAPDPFEQD
jgi:ferredoxin